MEEYCIDCPLRKFKKRNNGVGYCSYFHTYTHYLETCITVMTKLMKNRKAFWNHVEVN